jgi:hypothetical protein
VSISAATTITAAATEGSGLLVLASVGLLALALLTVGYLAVCWLRPFTRCRHHNPLRRAALCTRCHGSGRRVRPGRHLFNRLRDTRRRTDRIDNDR